MGRKPFNPDLIQPDEPRQGGGGLLPATAGAALPPSGPMTVSQVTALVKQAVETALPATIHVVGEISNLKRHSSGHLYFTLKDRLSELSCVMWKSSAAKLKFSPQSGLEVLATGTVEVFERAGRYQLYVRKLEPRGVGALELAFRQRCEELSREGLFDLDRKRPLPKYPGRIVLVTSPTGAAVTDMIRTIEHRYPCVHVLVMPVRVQGEGAADEIASAIRFVNSGGSALGGVDAMIVGRGGGSLEDLWAFNEEAVARAIFTSRIPIISAVGHEVDVTIADLVADARAPTPTAAASMAVPVLVEVLSDLSGDEARLRHAAGRLLELNAARLSTSVHRRWFREPMRVVHNREQELDEWASRLHGGLLERVHEPHRRIAALEPLIQLIAPHAVLLRRAVALQDREHRLAWTIERRLALSARSMDHTTRAIERSSPDLLLRRYTDRLDRVSEAARSAARHHWTVQQQNVRRCAERLAAMSHQSVIARGFSITRVKKGRKVVRSVEQLKDRERLVTEVADGTFESEVVNRNQLELFD